VSPSRGSVRYFKRSLLTESGICLTACSYFCSSANSGRKFVWHNLELLFQAIDACHECSSCLEAMTCSGPPTNRTNASAAVSLSPTDRCNRYWTELTTIAFDLFQNRTPSWRKLLTSNGDDLVESLPSSTSLIRQCRRELEDALHRKSLLAIVKPTFTSYQKCQCLPVALSG